MPLNKIRLKIINIGKGLLAKIKYGVTSDYSKYDFMKLKHDKGFRLSQITEHTLFQKIK